MFEPDKDLRGKPLAIHPRAASALIAKKAATIGEIKSSWREDFDSIERSARTYERVGNVGIIRISGVIIPRIDPVSAWYWGCTATDAILDAIGAASAASDIDAVLLVIDSPGGSVEMIQQVADAVLACPHPVIAHTSLDCMSAAYWIASQASYVYAARGAEVGSIGCYMLAWDDSQMLASYGLRTELFTSGPIKGAGSQGQPLSDEQRAFLQASVDKTAAAFRADIERRRKLPDACYTGAYWTSEEAINLGLIDGVATLADTMAIADNIASGTPAPNSRSNGGTDNV